MGSLITLLWNIVDSVIYVLPLLIPCNFSWSPLTKHNPSCFYTPHYYNMLVLFLVFHIHDSSRCPHVTMATAGAPHVTMATLLTFQVSRMKEIFQHANGNQGNERLPYGAVGRSYNHSVARAPPPALTPRSPPPGPPSTTGTSARQSRARHTTSGAGKPVSITWAEMHDSWYMNWCIDNPSEYKTI